MITIFIGKSAAGKDTFLRKEIIDGKKAVVSYTTRPMRNGEKDGYDYNFVSKDEFMELVDNNKIAEYRSYDTLVNGIKDTWYYGSPVLNPREDFAAVLDVKGTEGYLRLYGSDNLKIIFVTADDDVREERAMKRGSFDKTEWDRRAKDDAIKFSPEAIAKLEILYNKRILTINNN